MHNSDSVLCSCSVTAEHLVVKCYQVLVCLSDVWWWWWERWCWMPCAVYCVCRLN